MFSSLVSTCGRLVGWRKQPAGAEGERRVWVRYPCDVKTLSQPAGGRAEERLVTRVRNISPGGINLVVNRRFEPGMLLCVELPAAEGQASSVLAYVVHAKEESAGEWALGCTFAAELSDEDLHPFGAKQVKPAAGDNRAWVRFPCAAQASYHAVPGDEKSVSPARVLDLSPRGIGLEVDGPVEVGALLSLNLCSARGYTLTILASVVRVNRGADGRRALGCNFIRELSDAELASLG